MEVEFGARADAEFLEALAWYLERGLKLGERFAEEVERTSAAIGENPHRWPEVEPELRRALLPSFPYFLLYSIDVNRVFVLAVVHQKRNPAYGRDRK